MGAENQQRRWSAVPGHRAEDHGCRRHGRNRVSQLGSRTLVIKGNHIMTYRALITTVSVSLCAIVVASAQTGSQTPGAPAGGSAPGSVKSGGIVVPTITLLPGLTPVPDYDKVKVPDAAPQIPDGFEPLFNGKDLTGWHVSKTARHGRTPDFRVVHGVLLGTQQPYGQGGMLVTDKKYRNFELTLEAKPDWGCDSGIFFRA